jgi:hypothetical protein
LDELVAGSSGGGDVGAADGRTGEASTGDQAVAGVPWLLVSGSFAPDRQDSPTIQVDGIGRDETVLVWLDGGNCTDYANNEEDGGEKGTLAEDHFSRKTMSANGASA